MLSIILIIFVWYLIGLFSMYLYTKHMEYTYISADCLVYALFGVLALIAVLTLIGESISIWRFKE